jgi:hypothetical protein
MSEPTYRIESSGDAQTWLPVDGSGDNVYMGAYKRAKGLSEVVKGTYFVVRNLETTSRLVCFRDGEIVDLRKV